MTGQAQQRILVAVDDSPAALEGVLVATRLAVSMKARMKLMHVLADGALARALRRPGEAGPAEPAGEPVARQESQALLRRLAGHAQQAGVEVEAEEAAGDPGARLLDEARRWQADLVVVGRSDVREPGSPYVGRVTRHILEFSECPVLVAVAKPGRRDLR